MKPANSHMLTIIENWLPNAEGCTRDSHYTLKMSDELSAWAAFFKANPTRHQVLQTCCRQANSRYCSSLEEMFLFNDIASIFYFEENEWFDNAHKVDADAWFYGMCHFNTVIGNEKDFSTPCEDSFEG